MPKKSNDLSTFTRNFITTVESARISINLEKMFACVCGTRERNQNSLSILSGLMVLIVSTRRIISLKAVGFMISLMPNDYTNISSNTKI